jgi:spermidine/putrescine transport system ATP-binding protein
VSKHFGEGAQALTVIRDLNLSIGKGEFFSLLGPSGCGKTTALRMIGGFEHPSEGDVLLDGESIIGVPPYRRDVNMVFQSYSLFPHMDVYDNIEYGLRRKGLPREERRRRIADVIALAQLDAYVSRRPSQLSGGQQQRVALARALVNQPRVLLLDEPLAALDAKLRASMQEELRRIQREVGITFVFVTHDQQEAFALSDRVAVMRAGRLEQAGTPVELYNKPATRFVADFVGQSNFISGPVAADACRVLDLGSEGDRVFLPSVAPGARATIVVRPEQITLHAGQPELRGESLSRLSGVVSENTFLGSKHVLRIRTCLPEPILVEASHDLVSALSPDPGQPLWLSWRSSVGALLAD